MQSAMLVGAQPSSNPEMGRSVDGGDGRKQRREILPGRCCSMTSARQPGFYKERIKKKNHFKIIYCLSKNISGTYEVEFCVLKHMTKVYRITSLNARQAEP